MSGEQPVLVFKDEAPVGEEAAGGTGNVSLRPQAFTMPTTTGFHDARQVAQLDHPVCLGGGPRRENLLVRLVGTWR